MLVPRRLFQTSSIARAGHSKWQNVKHRKARSDASRSVLNTKVANQLIVASREGGGPDPANNVRLATMIENAQRQSVPKKVIDGAIARASKTASGPGENAQSMTYEGVGPGGVAFIVEALTENKNRTAQQVRAAFQKHRGSLSPTAFMFQRRGFIVLDTDNFDEVFEKSLDLGVEDVANKEYDGITKVTVYTEASDLSKAAEELRKMYKIKDMGLGYDATQPVQLEEFNEDIQSRLQKLWSDLDDLDDVSSVYTNLT